MGAAVHAGALEGLLAETETLGPMQASLIRAFAVKMRKETGAKNFDAAIGAASSGAASAGEREGGAAVDVDNVDNEGGDRDGGGFGLGAAWDPQAMAAAAAAAGLDLQEDVDYFDDGEEDEWGPEDLSELLSDEADFEEGEEEEGEVLEGGGSATE